MKALIALLTVLFLATGAIGKEAAPLADDEAVEKRLVNIAEDLLDEIPGTQGAFRAVINAWPAGAKPTVHDFLTTLSIPQMVVGSPETIAAELADYQAAGVDGVQIMNILMPQSYDEFFEHVVPVLQDKGLMQKQYRPGSLRQKLFDVDAPDISKRHPAFGYRGMFTGR